MNIYQRINEVRKKVAYIRKDRQVERQYMAVTHDAVTAELRESLIEYGIIITPPSVISSRVAETGTKTHKGIPFIRYEATFEIAYVNMEEPTDRVVFHIEAHAIDTGDKAPGKAMSYATKYSMLKMFNIETGEDEESRRHEHDAVAQRVSEETIKDWQDKIEKTKSGGALQTLWKQIADTCAKAADRETYEAMKAKVTEKNAALKKPAKESEAATA